jgi:anti-sigma28 factor (negative regulator of flagellin synthesis)
MTNEEQQRGFSPMRIDESNIQQTISATTSRAGETQRVQGDDDSSTPGKSPSGDHVALSSLAGRISQAVDALKSQTAQRVSQLQKDYQAGRYQPSASQISSAVLSQGFEA